MLELGDNRLGETLNRMLRTAVCGLERYPAERERRPDLWAAYSAGAAYLGGKPSAHEAAGTKPGRRKPAAKGPIAKRLRAKKLVPRKSPKR